LGTGEEGAEVKYTVIFSTGIQGEYDNNLPEDTVTGGKHLKKFPFYGFSINEKVNIKFTMVLGKKTIQVEGKFSKSELGQHIDNVIRVFKLDMI
jgi:hypothetical protein